MLPPIKCRRCDGTGVVTCAVCGGAGCFVWDAQVAAPNVPALFDWPAKLRQYEPSTRSENLLTLRTTPMSHEPFPYDEATKLVSWLRGTDGVTAWEALHAALHLADYALEEMSLPHAAAMRTSTAPTPPLSKEGLAQAIEGAAAVRRGGVAALSIDWRTILTWLLQLLPLIPWQPTP